MQSDPRLATPADLYAVQEIVQCAYSPYVSRIGRKPGPMLDDYAALIAANRVHVVERYNVVQGLVVLIPEHDAMLLHNVAVAPAAQGAGLGRTMLQYAEQVAKETGYDRIKLFTNEVMTENIALYARLGFSEMHRTEEKGLRRVYMAKVLP